MNYKDEDSYMDGAVDFLNKIIEYPRDYLDSWNLEEEFNPDQFSKMIGKFITEIKKVKEILIDKRRAEVL